MSLCICHAITRKHFFGNDTRLAGSMYMFFPEPIIIQLW